MHSGVLKENRQSTSIRKEPIHYYETKRAGETSSFLITKVCCYLVHVYVLNLVLEQISIKSEEKEHCKQNKTT